MFSRSYAGTHEERRRTQRPRREDDLACSKARFGAIGPADHRRDGAAAFEGDASHSVVRQDSQVAAATHASIEIAEAAGGSRPLETAVGQGAMSVAEIGIGIFNVRDAAMRRR